MLWLIDIKDALFKFLYRKKMKKFAIAIILIILSCSSVYGWNLHHANPSADSFVPISGRPFYVENITVGSPISDYGSHCGIKAVVEDDYAVENAMHVPAKSLLNSAHYVAYTDFSGQVDQFFVKLVSAENPTEELFFPYDRSIEFFPWGFEERGTQGGIQIVGRVHTLDTDLFGYSLRVTNNNSESVEIAPHLFFQRDGDQKDESLNIFPVKAKYQITPFLNQNSVVLKLKGKDLWRIVKTDFVLDNAKTIYLNKRVQITADGVEIEAGETVTLSWAVFFARSEPDAIDAIVNIFPENIADHWGVAQDRWEELLGSIPSVHSDESGYQDLAELAVIGLWMNLYAPRNQMTGFGSVPSKGHFSSFWGWDTAFQAMGHARLDTEIAKDNLSLLFSGPDNRVYLELADDLTPNFPPNLTQPPVTGWAIWDVFIKDQSQDVGWLANLYLKSKDYLKWWEETKDVDGDGLCEFTMGVEVGWDDNPRYHCNLPVTLCIERTDYIDSLTLNSWLYTYYMAMEKMAEVVAPHEKEMWHIKGRDLGMLIEQYMWSEPYGAYFDMEFDGVDHRLHHVLTPAVAWPLFAGLARDPLRVRRVVEEHLLVKEEFFGEKEQMPFPTVAFSDFAYDHDHDGFYWEGQAWLVTSYAMIKALFRYGYEKEANLAARRTINAVIKNDPGGIYEAYDAKTGRTGFSTNGRLLGGPGEPAAFQFGWSCTFLLELLFEEYQRHRYLMPWDTSFEGHIEKADEIETGQNFFFIDSTGSTLPHVYVKCLDDSPITNGCLNFSAEFTNPWNNEMGDSIAAHFPTLNDVEVIFQPDKGELINVEILENGAGTSFFVNVDYKGKYLLSLFPNDFKTAADKESDENNGNNCCG